LIEYNLLYRYIQMDISFDRLYKVYSFYYSQHYIFHKYKKFTFLFLVFYTYFYYDSVKYISHEIVTRISSNFSNLARKFKHFLKKCLKIEEKNVQFLIAVVNIQIILKMNDHNILVIFNIFGYCAISILVIF
jgi:hypothetical protein